MVQNTKAKILNDAANKWLKKNQEHVHQELGLV